MKRNVLVLEGYFGCFGFLSSTIDPKGCWLLPDSSPSSASILQYCWMSCLALPFLCIWMLCPKRTKVYWDVFHRPALYALPEKILSLSNLCASCKDMNSCKLASGRRFAARPYHGYTVGSMGYENVQSLYPSLSWTVSTAGVLPANDRWSWNFTLNLWLLMSLDYTI